MSHKKTPAQIRRTAIEESVFTQNYTPCTSVLTPCRSSPYGTNSKKNDFLFSIGPTPTSVVSQTCERGVFTV